MLSALLWLKRLKSHLFQMANHTLSMQNIDDDKPVALSVKNIERDTFAKDEEPKNTPKGKTIFMKRYSMCTIGKIHYNNLFELYL